MTLKSSSEILVFYIYALLIHFIFTNNYYYCFVIRIRLYFKILIMERWCDL